MIFQEPMTALDPVYTIGAADRRGRAPPYRRDRAAARARALELLDLVRIPSPERRLDAYPHELSGGLRQRAMIAMALSCQPRLLLADEPTTALDATVQVQVLILLRRLQRELGMGMIFVTHDLGVAAEIADRIAVMYAGRIVESGPVADVLRAPAHPYTPGCSPRPCTARRATAISRPSPAARPICGACRRAAPSRRAAPGGCRNAATPCRRRAFRRRADGGLHRRARRDVPAAVKARLFRAGDAEPGSECRAADRSGSVEARGSRRFPSSTHTAVPAKAGSPLVSYRDVEKSGPGFRRDCDRRRIERRGISPRRAQRRRDRGDQRLHEVLAGRHDRRGDAAPFRSDATTGPTAATAVRRSRGQSAGPLSPRSRASSNRRLACEALVKATASIPPAAICSISPASASSGAAAA